MNNRLISVALTVAVAVIVTTMVLVPITNSSSFKENVEYENEATNYYNKVTTATITADTGDDWSVTINGTVMTVPDYACVIMSDTLSVFAGLKNLNAFDPVNDKFAVAGEGADVSITIADGEYSATFGDNTITGTIGDCMLFSGTEGDYLMTPAGTVNMNTYGIGYVGLVLWGEKQGVVEMTNLASGTQTFSLKTITDFQVASSSDSTVTWEVVDNGDQTYDISAFVESDGVTPVNMIIPTKYTALEETNESNIMGIVPIIVIIGILMWTVGAIFVVKRR